MRAVLDTNVLVSATIHPGGAPRRIVENWLARRFILVISPTLIAELLRVLGYPRIARKYHITDSDIRVVLGRILTLAELVDDPSAVPQVIDEDPPDNFVLGCAEAGRVDFIVSGDDHLLKLGSYKEIPIVPPRAFAHLLVEPS